MAAKAKKPKNGYKMPDPIPPGEIIRDMTKKEWRFGPSIGKGGFGEIYSAQEASVSGSKYPYVIKVEPHSNGPLFVEMHFYMKNAKSTDVVTFRDTHKLKTFGMPEYITSGSFEFKNEKYRFLVMEKFGKDLDNVLKSTGGALPPATVFQIASQMVFVLEYIHGTGYVHADIKGGNILLGSTPSTKNQAYLVDFGLATKFTSDKVFKPNPKKAHDGTIEYLSRDAHQGVQTRRGDLEILGYNIIHWLGGKLPWMDVLTNPSRVEEKKKSAMSNIGMFLEGCFGAKTPPECVKIYLTYVSSLSFDEKPDYNKVRAIFTSGIKASTGKARMSTLEFTEAKNCPVKRKSTAKDLPAKKVKKADKADEPEEVKKTSRTKKVEREDEPDEVEVKKTNKRTKKDEKTQLPDDEEVKKTRRLKVDDNNTDEKTEEKKIVKRSKKSETNDAVFEDVKKKAPKKTGVSNRKVKVETVPTNENDKERENVGARKSSRISLKESGISTQKDYVNGSNDAANGSNDAANMLETKSTAEVTITSEKVTLVASSSNAGSSMGTLTNAMKDVMAKLAEKKSKKTAPKPKKKKVEEKQEEVNLDGFNEEMKEIMLRKMENAKAGNKKKGGSVSSTASAQARTRRNLRVVNYKEQDSRIDETLNE